MPFEALTTELFEANFGANCSSIEAHYIEGQKVTMSLSIEGITEAEAIDAINDASTSAMGDDSIVHFVLHWLIIIAVPAIIVTYLCCCATTKDKKTLSDITQERLDAQQEVTHAIEMVNPDELRTQAIARLLPSAPSTSMEAAVAGGASTSQVQPSSSPQQELSSSTNEETKPKPIAMLLKYDKESKLYGWTTDTSSSAQHMKTRKKNISTHCSICLESFGTC